VNTAEQPKTKYQCRYCEKEFLKESSLAVHVCEPKRRYQEQNEVGVKIGMQAYLRFYEITQGSAKLKTFDDFARSPYYRAFVKFGRYCVSIRAINIPRYTEWVVRQNKKIDHWIKDSVYSEYLFQYLRDENVSDALGRAMETAIDWAEQTQSPDRDYLRFGNDNILCYAVSTGRISPWVLYNCESGTAFLERINQEQVAMIWPMIDADFWQKKFQDYSADTEYARDILKKAGW
jgi:hypothetical protein